MNPLKVLPAFASTTVSAIFQDDSATLLPCRQAVNAWRKVPEVTAYFWIITILVSGMGETVADALNTDWHVGVAQATWLIGGTLVLALTAQFTLNRYVPAVYWLAVVLASTVGTLFTANLTTGFGIPLPVLAAMFTVVVLAVFAVWYAVERTVSIDSVVTVPRESFYWVAIIGMFALGTVLSRLLVGRFGTGYLGAALIAAAAICGMGALLRTESACDDCVLGCPCSHTIVGGIPG